MICAMCRLVISFFIRWKRKKTLLGLSLTYSHYAEVRMTFVKRLTRDNHYRVLMPPSIQFFLNVGVQINLYY